MNTITIAMIILLVIAGIAAFIVNRNIRVAETNAKLRSQLFADSAKTAGNNIANVLQSKIENLMVGSGMTYTAYEMLVVWIIATLVPPFLVLMFNLGLELALLAALVGFVLPMIMINSKKKSNRKKFESLLGEAMPLIAANLKGGFSPRDALDSVSKCTSEPLKSEFVRIVNSMAMGSTLEDALHESAIRNKSHDLEIFSAAVAVHSKKGGNLSPVVAQVGETIRERAKLRSLIDSKTAAAKTQCKVLVALPVIEVVALMAIHEPSREFYLSVEGIALLAVAAAMIGAAVYLVNRMSNIGSM